MKGERGFALVITLIVTALLVALLVEFVSEVYVDASHSHNFVASQQAGILAESGVAGGIQILAMSALIRRAQNQTTSSLTEQWAQPLFYDAGVGQVNITIEEENGKFDLNAATSPNGATRTDFYGLTAQRLLTTLQLPSTLYDTLSDWMSTGDSPRPNGAKNNYYSTLTPSYQTHNQKLSTFEELALVKGYTPQIMALLRSCATVYPLTGISAPININTAPKSVLLALDPAMTNKLADEIIAQRAIKPLASLNDLADLGKLVQLTGNVVFIGSIYRIHAEGKVGECVSVAEAVVTNVSQQKPSILYWREY
jgi:general secretion pathway protein K